jgi:hypothetical protein
VCVCVCVSILSYTILERFEVGQIREFAAEVGPTVVVELLGECVEIKTHTSYFIRKSRLHI